MAFPKIQEVRNLSDDELVAAILDTKRQLFQLRFQQGTRKLEGSHQFKHLRHRLGQLMTVERERQTIALEDTLPSTSGGEQVEMEGD